MLNDQCAVLDRSYPNRPTNVKQQAGNQVETIIVQRGGRATDWTPSEMAVQHQKES